MKAGIVEQEEAIFAKQWNNKFISIAANQCVTLELQEAVFYMW
jgi:hypothetical protein